MAQNSIVPVHTRMDKLLLLRRYEVLHKRNERVVSTSPADVHMEKLETSKDKVCQPAKVWHNEKPCVAMGKYP